LKLTLRVWEHGLVDENGQPIYTEQYVHIPLGELCDPYAGTSGEIDVVEDHGQHVISLADKTVTETVGTALTPAHGGAFNVVTAVTCDSKGRIEGVETSQVTLPAIADGSATGDGTFVDVTVKTVGGVVTEVSVSENDIASAAALATLDAEVQDHELVVSAALNDLNARIEGVAGDVADLAEVVDGLDLGVKTLTASTTSAHVTVTPVEASKGEVTVTVDVASVDATTEGYTAAGLATDAYVREQIAAAAMVWEAF
jgi:hypothetical protein